MPVQYGGDKITFSDGSTVGSGWTGMKNRIINGAMMIDQRNAGASVTPTNGAYTLDRWTAAAAQASKFTVQQNAGSVTPPAGFKNYLGVTSSSSYSVTTGDVFAVAQGIEGFNVADLGWGTANAQTVTLSFWVRSSLTGTFGGTVKNAMAGATRSYPFSYTILAANTWEQKTVTITGDTGGTWNTSNGCGMEIGFSIGTASDSSGTAGSWSSNNYWSVTGATSVVGTSGATFYITGVQLEKGSTATSFDYRPYSAELAMCQRYYFRNKATDVNQMLSAAGQCYATTGAVINIVFPVPMRTSPTSLEQTGSVDDYAVWNAGTSNVNINAVPSFNGASTFIGRVGITTASGLVAGNVTSLLSRATSNAYLGWSAEL